MWNKIFVLFGGHLDIKSHLLRLVLSNRFMNLGISKQQHFVFKNKEFNLKRELNYT